MKKFVVYGPPGTGKTTCGISLATTWLKTMAPEEIAYLAFTKSAATEAASRILGVTGGEQIDHEQLDEEFPYFRTIHSLCYKLMNMATEDHKPVISTNHMKAFAEASGMEGSYAVNSWEDLADVYMSADDQGRTDWDRISAAYNLSRLSCRNTGELAAVRKQIHPAVLRRSTQKQLFTDQYAAWVHRYELYKEREGVIDFTDMLEAALSMPPIPVRRLIVDECVPAGTMITMSDGSQRKIETLNLGETILGYDHKKQCTAPARIVERRRSRTGRLVKINGSLPLTPNHPVYVVDRGYVRADEVKVGDRILEVCNNKVPLVQANRKDGVGKPKEKAKVLFSGVRPASCEEQALAGEKEGKEFYKGVPREAEGRSYKMPGVRKGICDKRETCQQAGPVWEEKVLLVEVLGSAEVHKEGACAAVSSHEAAQSHVDSGCQGKGNSYAQADHMETAFSGREWSSVDETAEAPDGIPGGRLGGGTSNTDRGLPGLEVGQAGHRALRSQDCGGVRRRISLYSKAKGDRPEEGRGVQVVGLEGGEIQEFRDLGVSPIGTGIALVTSIEKIDSGCEVYNIGTETENYFAQGILVHNCQDLTPLHFTIMEKLFYPVVEETWQLGDDDQSIFSWAGASADDFLDQAVDATPIVLRQTHRFGKELVDFAAKIISRVGRRMEKDVIGLADRQNKISEIGEFKPFFGPALLLHRHVMGCQNLASKYIDAGIPFHNERGKSPLGAKVRTRAFQALSDLADYKPVSYGQIAAAIVELVPTVHEEEGHRVNFLPRGAKKKLQERQRQGDVILDHLVAAGFVLPDFVSVVKSRNWSLFKHGDDLMYYARLLKGGWKLSTEGAPIITTMHASKGREREEVVVFTEHSRTCWQNPDDEHRLAYVAVTRAQRNLTICADRMLKWATVRYEYPFEANHVRN